MLLLGDGGRRYGGKVREPGRVAGGRLTATVGYADAPLGRFSAGGHRSPAAELRPLRLRPAWPKRVVAALLLAAAGAALWAGLASEHPMASRAARPAHATDAVTAPSKGLSSLPLAAQGVVSATLGSANGAYHVSRSGPEYQAVNPAQGLRVRFDRAGVRVQSGQARLGLRLSAVGYGASLTSIAPVVPRAHGNRVMYARGGLSEWYANGPLGLEQGFTLTRAPTGDTGKPLTLSLALSGDVRASVDAGGRGIALAAPGDSSLRYDDLLATDARGRTLHSWITLHGGRVLLHVNARGARYPLLIDPLVRQGEKLTAGAEETGKAFTGYSVALSSEGGNTALVGGYEENSGEGAAWVFTRSGVKWTLQKKLTPGPGYEGPKGWFGIGVALSANGKTALIGAPLDNSSVGAAWAYTYSSGKWEPSEKLKIESGEVGTGNFGHGVALSADGKTALIGAFGDTSCLGAAWVLTYSSSNKKWEHGEKLSGEGEEELGEGYFGFSVAISGDGKTALIGGHVEKNHVGAAWVFTISGNEGTQRKKLTAGEGEVGKGNFGYSVALSYEGNTAAVGAFSDNVGAGAVGAGAVWVFTRSEGIWTRGEKLTGGTEETGEGAFGFSVALTHDGKTLLVGGVGDNEYAGAAWEFKYSGSKWTQQGEKLTGGSEEIGKGSFGSDVALDSEGETAFIGGEYDNEYFGAAWPFVAALESLLAEWLVGGVAVATELSTQTSGELSLEDSKAPIIGKAKVLCGFILDGWVGPSGSGRVNEVLNLAGEAISSTPLSGLALECTAEAGCESGSAPKVWPIGLGWETEAKLMEDASNFFALLSLPHSGGSNPGWYMECLVLGTSVSDECKAPEGVAELALEGTTLLGKLSLAFTELAKGTLALCSQSKEETGVFEGENTITLNGGGELTASYGSLVS